MPRRPLLPLLSALTLLALLAALRWPAHHPCEDLEQRLCALPGADCAQVRARLVAWAPDAVGCRQHLDLLDAWTDLPPAWQTDRHRSTLAWLLTGADGARLLQELLVTGRQPLPTPGVLVPPASEGLEDAPPPPL